jgi:thiosulfate reductase cytochrome b subunit
MNDPQEHASPYPPFESVPMPQNARDAHFILIIMCILWIVGFTLLFRLGKKNK